MPDVFLLPKIYHSSSAALPLKVTSLWILMHAGILKLKPVIEKRGDEQK